MIHSILSDNLHELFNQLPRLKFPVLDESAIPENGIYVLFEKGETYNTLDRIVRIGSHIGDGNLFTRLKEHFENPNKNRSIFRKNIGRCFLNRDNNPYLSTWELDNIKKASKEKNKDKIDIEFEITFENKITQHIRKNFSFVTIAYGGSKLQLNLEKRIISTIAKSHPVPSKNWLGNYSPKEKIRTIGLWQVNELNGEIISKDDLKMIQNFVQSEKEKGEKLK
jgi:hypothetical protein